MSSSYDQHLGGEECCCFSLNILIYMRLCHNNDQLKVKDNKIPFLPQSVLRKVTPGDAPKISDQIMTALLRMFESTSGKPGGGVQEDALLAMSTLIEGDYR